MKTKSILRIFAALIMMVGFAMTTVGQGQSDNDVVLGNALVAAQITVTGNTPLEFGNVTPGVTKTVSSAGVVGPGIAGGTTETAGKFTVTKGANTGVTLGFTLPSKLTKGADTLAINFADYAGPTKCGKLAYTNLTDVPFTPGSGEVIVNSSTTAPYFAAEEFWVNIGGTVVPLSGTVVGAYTATITLTATYN